MKTTLDLALTRWAVVCHQWRENGGIHPQVGAFLSGWFLRDMSPKGCPPPNVASFRDSFRRGWQEADTEIAIIDRQTQPLCRVCNTLGTLRADFGIALCEKEECWEAFRQEYNGEAHTLSEQNSPHVSREAC